MLFLDGVGIGRKDPAVNPFFASHLPALRSLLGGELPFLRRRSYSSRTSTVVPLDATLGIEGLPQSGTGQTALFTGVNASKLIGKHFGPHPYSTLRPVIQERNIFKQILDSGRTVHFANAFPQRFFDYLDRHPSRMSVTTLACTMSGVPLQKADDLAQGRAISADITSAGWKNLGYPSIPVIEPVEAGRRLASFASTFDFVLFEYWRTDHAGHSRSMQESIEVLELFDAMLGGILETLDVRSTLLVITSDHGNIEDLSTKTHTRNPVPCILHGHRHAEFASRIRHARRTSDLTQITPMLLEFFREEAPVPNPVAAANR